MRLSGGDAVRYDDGADRVVLAAVDRFYASNPGFCPVPGSFLFARDRPWFLSLAARGREVRALVYDRAAPEVLRVAVLSGWSRDALEVTACRSGVG